MIKLCLITPIKELDLSNYGNMFFALTKQLKEDKTYYEFFKKKKKLGFDVVVDNNIHESEEIDFEEHIRLALDVGTIIIIPDVLRNKKKTLEYFHYFMDRWFDDLKSNNIKIMAVPQGDTIEEINECFKEFNEDKRVDMIGNSFDLVPFKLAEEKYENQSMNRMLIVNDWCKTSTKRIHLLGSNNLNELYILSKHKQVYSTDGKYFSRTALANIHLTPLNWRTVTKQKDIKMNFEDKFTSTQANLFIKNVKFFREVLNDRHI